MLYRVIGRTDDGYLASGQFSVMRPAEAPTPEKSDFRVQDPQMIAKILAAQRLLGQKSVTDEDIWRLQRLGKLEGATVDRSQLPARWVDEPAGPKGLASSSPASR